MFKTVFNVKKVRFKAMKKKHAVPYLPLYSSGYGIMYPSGLGRGEFPTQKNASGPVPSYANPLMNSVDSSTAYTKPWR